MNDELPEDDDDDEEGEDGDDGYGDEDDDGDDYWAPSPPLPLYFNSSWKVMLPSKLCFIYLRMNQLLVTIASCEWIARIYQKLPLILQGEILGLWELQSILISSF